MAHRCNGRGSDEDSDGNAAARKSLPPNVVSTFYAEVLSSRGFIAVESQDSSRGHAAHVAAFVRTPRSRAAAPYEINLDGCGLRELPELQGEDSLARLSLRENHLTAAPVLPHAIARTLSVLDLSNNRLRDARAVAALTRLRALLLGRNRLENIAPLQGLTRLEVLDISHNRLTSLAGLESLIGLAVLRAGHNAAVTGLPCLTGLTALTELSLAGCPVVSVVTVSSPQHPSKQQQALCSNSSHFGDEGAGGGFGKMSFESAPLVLLPLLPASLQRLSLRCCGLPSFAAAAPLRRLHALQRLTLEGNPFALPARQSPGDCYRPLALACCCPMGLRALDGEAITPEERVLLIRANAAADVTGGAQLDEQRLLVLGRQLALKFDPSTAADRSKGEGPRKGGRAAEAVVAWQGDDAIDGMEEGGGSAEDVFGDGFLVPSVGIGSSSSCNDVACAAAVHTAACEEVGSFAREGLAGGFEGSSGSEASECQYSKIEEEVDDETAAAADRWWQAHASEARGSASSDGGASSSGGDSACSLGTGAMGGGFAAVEGGSPEGPGGWWDPITDQELEGTYLLTEGVLLASRGPRRRQAAGRMIAPGIEFDGRCLCLTGGVLRALKMPSYAAVSEVKLCRVAFDPHIMHALPSLEALPRLSRLSLDRNRIATLPQLDCLLRLPRLRMLSVTGSPVERLVLLRPYVAHRLRQLVAFNGVPLTASEREEGAALFGALDCELAASLIQPGQRAALAAAGLPGPPPPEEPLQAPPRPWSSQQQRPTSTGSGSGGDVGAALLEGARKHSAQSGSEEPSHQLPQQQQHSEQRQQQRDLQQQGTQISGARAWLPNVLAHLSGGAALAAPFAAGARAGAQGRAFFERWVAEAEEVRSRLEELDACWGPAFLEPCIEEGWRGQYRLPGG